MINILELECSKGWGGQEKRTIRLINGLDKSKYRVFYGVFADSQIAARKNEIDAEILHIPIKQSYDVFALLKVLSAIKHHKIDIISTHSGKDGWIGAVAGKIAGVPIVRVRHLQTPINSPFSYNLSTKVVAVSENVREYLQNMGVKKEKLITIYTGVDTQAFSPELKVSLKNKLGLAEDAVLIGIVAVLRAAKNHKLLIEAIKELQNCALAIIGTGPQEESIKSLIVEHSLQNRVFMLGHRDDVPRILPSLDIFVLPSKMEALGTSILEASSCGVPCIGSRVGGIPECIEDGVSGYLFESENVEELRAKLKTLIENESLRKEMGKNARELVLKRFSNEAMIQNTEALYDELAKR